MDMIERFGRKVRLGEQKSLIEKAVDRLGTEALHPPVSVPPTAPAANVIREPIVPPSQDERSASVQHVPRKVTLDFDRLRTFHLQVPDDASLMAEEFRIIKRRLLLKAFAGPIESGHKLHVIMVTSPHPGEGKTFVAANLALSIASERDVRVLLIDADVARPSIPTLFGFEGKQGLIDVLEDGSINLADVLIHTNLENLEILSNGTHSRLATELFASSRMKRFLDDIAYQYKNRVIIFDSPPVLLRTEANILVHHVGQVVLVVSAGQTTQSSIREALSHIDADKITGVVLNKLHPRLARERFGKYYGSYKH